jgi:hypothetical protein
MMTPEEFKQAIEKCADESTEEGHIEADGILCDLLFDLGYGEGAKEFGKLHKWYS